MSDERSSTESSGGSGFIARTPRWVLVGGAALIVVLIVVLLLLVVGDDHGPSRHM